jgi:hypothetical protein
MKAEIEEFGFYIADSKIDGQGIFAARHFKKGDKVLPWPNDLHVGNYSDCHGFNYLADGNLTLRATGKFANRDIAAGEELTVKVPAKWLKEHYLKVFGHVVLFSHEIAARQKEERK